MSDHSEFADDDLDEREYPDDDQSDDDDPETVECPECHRQVYEEAEQCPYCGQYITHDTRVWAGKPWWWTALALAGIVGLIWVLVIGV
jgi:uncharacterized paraquat-inducible protein A